MPAISVLNLDSYRWWKDQEDLGVDWLANQFYALEQTPAMKRGHAFHKAIETACENDCCEVECEGFRFYFQCDCEIQLTPSVEMYISKLYGDLLVRGKVDSIVGNAVVDHKTTEHFDPERLMFGYQWRYYLDITGLKSFVWNVFVMKEADDPNSFVITDFHKLEQCRYPDLHKDCSDLAADYLRFWNDSFQYVSRPMTLEQQLEASLAARK